MNTSRWLPAFLALILVAACGESKEPALEEKDPLHLHGIKLPPPKKWEPIEEKAKVEMIEVPPPPFSDDVFPCSRCHIGGPAVVDTAPAIPHKRHLDRDLVCADCHNPDDENAAPRIPKTETCFECHENLAEEPEGVKAYFAAIRKGDGKDTYVFPRRWDLEDVNPNHVGHAKAKIGCVQCHGEPSNGPFVKPKPLVLMRRCIDCHKDRKVPAECSTCHEKQKGPDYHKIVLRHAEHQRGCFGCHNPDDRDTLRLANGTPISFEKSYLLCGQCHGPKLRDWKNGLHGKRKGMWDGEKKYLLCVHCHRNPHAPQFPKMTVMPPPARPENIK